MDRHAVPRQVTTFEFKLIGWFTIKQFIYLLVFAGITVVTFFLIPVPILNFIMAALVAALGIALVFYKHNDRTLDVWIKNLIVSLTQPSQFMFHKENDIPAFLKGVYIYPDQQVAETHVDANAKLQNYMQQSGQKEATSDEQKQKINVLMHNAQPVPTSQQSNQTSETTIAAQQQDQQIIQETVQQNKPFVSGIVRNSKDVVLPNIMIYVNSEAGQVVRILKTNHNGIFATFHPLPSGNYILSPKDLGGTYFFDTMNITVDGPVKDPLQINSKEIL